MCSSCPSCLQALSGLPCRIRGHSTLEPAPQYQTPLPRLDRKPRSAILNILISVEWRVNPVFSCLKNRLLTLAPLAGRTGFPFPRVQFCDFEQRTSDRRRPPRAVARGYTVARLHTSVLEKAHATRKSNRGR